MYEGELITLIHTIEYKWIYIEINMTEAEREELGKETVITMNDIECYDWTIVEGNEGTSDWEINGNISNESKQQLLFELEQNGYMDVDELGWEDETFMGITLQNNNLIFDE